MDGTRRRRNAGITLFPLFLLWTLAAPASGAEVEALSERGETLFQRLCASCHGAAGAGDGPAARSLRAAPADLRAIAARREGRFDRREVAAIIDGRTMPAGHGSDEMPVWGCFELRARPGGDDGQNERMRALIAWLESIQRE